jgi:hypothetical protein
MIHRPNYTSLLQRASLLIALSVSAAGHASPQYFIVGNTQGGAARCEYETIQSALDAALANGPDLDYVFVTNTVSYTNQALVVGNQSVLIEGGYDDCDLSSPGPAATIHGDYAHSVVDIQTGISPGRSITLRHLDLSGGDAPFGGAVHILGSAYVLIEDVVMHDNKASYGGGISSAQAILAIGKDVGILNNTARRQGGGMYLQGGTVHIQNDRTTVSGNHVQYDSANLPSGLGGGIYATRFATTPLDILIGAWQYQAGDPRPPISGFAITNNRADDKGGGIYLDGPSVSLIAQETSVTDNSAANSGGAVFIYNGGSVQLSRDFPGAPPAPQCANYLQCNVIRGNSVDSHSSYVAAGGAINVQVGSVRLIQTAVLQNSADSGSAINVGNISGAANPPNTIRLQGALVSRNNCLHGSNFRPCSTIDLGSGADARISYSTFADNTHASGSSPAEIYAFSGVGSSLTLLSSILQSAVPIVFQGGATSYQTDCVISSNSVLTMGTRSQVGAPGFNNPAKFDYRLRSKSLATDYCDNANTLNDDFTDLALNARGFDDTQHGNLYGRFDVGAFESDHIFGDGYE